MVTLDADTNEEVQRRDLVKGYEFSKDRYLLLTDEDLNSVKVELTRQRLQPSMAVTMQVDPAPVHVAPRPERVVAQHDTCSIDGHFRVGLDALPTIAAGDRCVVFVAGDEMFAIMQHPQQGRHALR
jgi:hypothetical protein